MRLEPFLTAYNPSDLPGGSIDPLGFETGYLFFAEKMLPGMTNVANRPRYFSVLCAGSQLAQTSSESPQREQAKRRLDCVLRLERLWALANVLASEEAEEDDLNNSGIRGVTYAISQAESLKSINAKKTDTHFPLLVRQLQYGAVGMYGQVAEKFKLWDRRSLTPTRDSGLRLAEAFLEETGAPKELERAVRKDDATIRLATLAEWGARSHVAAPVGEGEGNCLIDSAMNDPTRQRMLLFLKSHPSTGDESELNRIERVTYALKKSGENQDLYEACRTILAYEQAYKWALLCFERLLFLCRESQTGLIGRNDINADPVIKDVCGALPSSVTDFSEAMDQGVSENFRRNLTHVNHVWSFLNTAQSACQEPFDLAQVLLTRHRDVQQRKFDRGRRKMPWIDERLEGIGLTRRTVGAVKTPENPNQISAHPYRLGAADSLNAVSRAR